MKKTVFLLAGLMAVSAWAQQPATPAIVEPSVALVPGAATVSGKNVNVRARATINSEAIFQLNPGDTVTVIEQINLDKFKPEEPRQWAKIALPRNIDVWVHASFVDRATMTVIPPKLNVRSGPGENYGVLGVIERGTAVREILADGNWMRITAPADAYAFMAAMYLQQEPVAPTVAAAPVQEPVPAPEPVVETVVAPAEPAPVVAEDSAVASTAVLMTIPAPTLQPAETVVELPPPPRIVSHEGVVTTTKSIQAPTEYQLIDPVSGKTINYLHTTTPNLNLGLYRGLRIVVTGEEGLDARWKTPVITIRRIQVVE